VTGWEVAKWRKARLDCFAGFGVDDLPGRDAVRASDLDEVRLGEAEADGSRARLPVLLVEGVLGRVEARVGDEKVVALVALDRRDEPVVRNGLGENREELAGVVQEV
jgi:hypothetical protein